MSVFNLSNDSWETGEYPLFLGKQLGLLDSINRPYPQLFELYKLQKSIDWSEDEVNLEQSRMDLLQCSQNNYDIMLKTLAFQWELDSVASRSIAPLLAPFVSNSELWLMLVKQSEIENLHALTYSEIIRQCIADPKMVFDEVLKNDNILDRSNAVVAVFDQLEEIGIHYQKSKNTSGYNETLRPIILKTMITLYCLERIQFMSSFAVTFALAEQNIFQGIAKLVQKIAQDEQVHCMMDEAVLRILFGETEWIDSFNDHKLEISTIIKDIIDQELSWNKYLFSEGRNIVGLNRQLLDEWVLYNAQDVYDFLGIESDFNFIKTNPLTWMDNWLDLNKTQNANQEADNNNYSLNTVLNDIDDDILIF